MIVNNICTMLSQERYRSVFNIFSHETAYISVEVRTKVEDKLLYWYSQMNFLIDAESKLPSSNDPNPKGGNDPEKARESPPGRIRLFAAPTLFFSLLSFFLFFFSFFFSFLFFFFLSFLFFFFFVFDCKWRPALWISILVCVRTADGNRAVVLAKPGTNLARWTKHVQPSLFHLPS